MSKKSYLLIPALALSAALIGCDRPDDAPTPGQRADDAVSSTERRADTAPPSTAEKRADEMQADAKRGMDSAKQGVENAGDKAANAVSDATITAEVKSALAADPQLSALRIDVDTKDGVVTLNGPAPDEQARSRATQIAAAPKGVMRVDNQLKLKS